MLRRFSAKRIVLTAAVDWLGTLFALLPAAPPGVAGLWQERERNRVSFDEMLH